MSLYQNFTHNVLNYLMIFANFEEKNFLIEHYCLLREKGMRVVNWFLVLTIFNEGTYLTFKSILHKALNLF